MLGAEHLFAYRQRALEERPRPRKVALSLEQDGEVVEARRRIGMLGAEHLFADRQRALEERPRPRKVALVLEQDGEVVEALCRIGMLGAEHLLADRQRICEQAAVLGSKPRGRGNSCPPGPKGRPSQQCPKRHRSALRAAQADAA